MAKHRLDDAEEPVAKQQRHTGGQSLKSRLILNFDSSLYDELVLHIFSHLSWMDLCALEPTNRHWGRLSTDNQLWKKQFLREHGRLRLRGSRGFVRRKDGREMKPLPARAKDRSYEDDIDWKWMFRISLNWRKGRCAMELIDDSRHLRNTSLPTCLVLSGGLTISSQPTLSASPSIYLRTSSGQLATLTGTHRTKVPTCITALTLDQSSPSRDQAVRLAAFYDTGEFSIFHIDHSSPQASRRLLSFHPQHKSARTTPIRQAAYHHPLLITLSHEFHLSLYNLSGDTIVHTQTLTSFTSFPPTSLVLSAPTARRDSYKLVLAYAAPVFPSHWSVAVTELTVSPISDVGPSTSSRSCTVTGTRTTRAYDFPPGWIDEYILRDVKAQWGRKVARVADTQTDGKWVVLAPADRLPTRSSYSSSSALGTTSCALQLYRLHLPSSSSSSSSSTQSVFGGSTAAATSSPRLTFVRFLHGHLGPVVALSLADGRCVSLGADGSIWVWDLEKGWSAEVQAPRHAVGSLDFADEQDLKTADEGDVNDSTGDIGDENPEENIPHTLQGSIVFDERHVVSADSHGVEMRRFDI